MERFQSGWLEKKGRFVKNWKVRWFVLHINILEYFEDESERVKKGDIDINLTTKVLIRDGSTHLFKFGIQTGDRVLELSTQSDTERIKWMDSIHNIVRALNNPDIRSSNNSTSSSIPSLTIIDTGLKDKVSKLLSKKTNMDEDTLMNRALSGHSGMKESASSSSSTTPSTTTTSSGNTKTSRRVQRRPRNKTHQTSTTSSSSTAATASTNEKSTERLSDDSDHEGHVDQGVEDETFDQNPSSQSTTTSANTTNTTTRSNNLPPSSSSSEPSLPEGWAQVETEDGRIYYYHKVTRVSRWDLPSQEDTNQINEQIHQTEKKIVECQVRSYFDYDFSYIFLS